VRPRHKKNPLEKKSAFFKVKRSTLSGHPRKDWDPPPGRNVFSWGPGAPGFREKERDQRKRKGVPAHPRTPAEENSKSPRGKRLPRDSPGAVRGGERKKKGIRRKRKKKPIDLQRDLTLGAGRFPLRGGYP